MALSPMEEIFILLEDEKQVPAYRINRWGKVASGALAKLKKLGWAQKNTKSSETVYQITPKGEKEIDRLLASLKTTGKWDGKWRLVLFDIPEVQRYVRDRLRRALKRLGLGILQASVWITPNNIKNEVAEIEKRMSLTSKIKYFEISRNTNLDQKIIEKAWNLGELSDQYRKFNFNAERLLKTLNRDPNPRFTAKKLIFEYALILKNDPILVWEFRQKDQLRKAANELYLKLRKYIT